MVNTFPISMKVRHYIYQKIIDSTLPPMIEEIADHFKISLSASENILTSLADSHHIVLKPNSFDIWMAHPFSAIPTDLIVEVEHKKYWANCMWDVLGIGAVINKESTAHINCGCGECDDSISFEFSRDIPIVSDWIVHFLVPAREFWDDIGYT